MLRITILTAALATSVALVSSANSAANQPKSKDFVILNDDGYGTSDCLAKGSACGKIVADAWCESKGFAKSTSYRPVEPGDITATVPTRRAAADAFLISCSE